MVDAVKSKVSMVFVTGNVAALSRFAVFDASRAVSSASTRVRRTSSGVQRWVFAVSSSSGASRRTVASLSRRSPAARSAGSSGTCAGGAGRVGLVVVVIGSLPLRWWGFDRSPGCWVGRVGRGCVHRVVGQRRGRRHGQVEDQGTTGGHGDRGAGAGGQDGPDVGGAEPAERDRPAQRTDQGIGAVRRAQGEEHVQFGG